jgi:hypothetical protein
MAIMDAIEPHPGLFGRVRQLIAAPGPAWEAIAREEPGGVLKGHVAPLALAMALAGWLGAFWSAEFALNTATLMIAPAAALLRFVLIYLAVLVLAKLAEALAPRFEAEPARAAQVVGYSATGVLVAGLFMIFGGLAPYLLVIGAVYSAVLLYMGITGALGAPQARRGAYFGALLAGGVALLIAGSLVYGAAMKGVQAAAREFSASQTIAAAPAETAPPLLTQGAVLDAGALRRIGEANVWRGTPIHPEELEGFLPQSLPGGFEREAYMGSNTAGGAHAEATYTHGEARLIVTIHHFGRTGALAAVDAARDALVRRQDANGYARHQITDGRVVAENVTGAAIAYTIIGHGVAVSVTGEGGANVDDARAAVETIGMSRLEAVFAP